MDKLSNTCKLVSFDIAYERVTRDFQPKPHRRTVMAWLKTWKVRSTKRNPAAAHGGGRKYFAESDIERALAKLLK